MRETRVIYNPTPGKELLKKNLTDILQALEEAEFKASAYAAVPEPDSAKNETCRVAGLDSDLVVAAGGDDAISKVVNEIAPLKHHPKVTIISTSTANDYAQALKIPRDNIKAAVEAVKKHQTVRVDIGLSDSSYFISIATGGYLTESTYGVPLELESIFGYLTYSVKGAEMLPRVKPIKIHLKYNGGEYIGNASVSLLGLANSVGRFGQIAPDAKLDNEKFSLIVIETANIFEILHITALMLNGSRYVDNPGIICAKTSNLFVETEDGINRPVMISSDGEYSGEAPVHFQSLHQHIEFFANTDRISGETTTGTDEEELEVVSKEFVKKVERLTDKNINGDGKMADKTPNQKN